MKAPNYHMRKVQVAAALLLMILASWPPVHAQSRTDDALEWSPWAMTGSEIQASGAVRFSEIIRMMPAIETWSPDRYTLRFLGTGLGGMHPAGPAMYLDGVALPAFFLDRVLTESLPVSPGDLSALTWKPGLHVAPGGRMAEGRLDLTTPVLTGWEVAGAMAVINETGDPGPAKHSDARLNNVDRSGPATWLRLGWGNGRWMVQTGLQTDLHHLTDDRISGRIRRTYAEEAQPVITQFSPFARVRFEGQRWTGHLFSGHTRRKDFIYHEAAGWEWPARLNRSWLTGRLVGNLGSAWTALDLDGSRVETGTRPAFIEVPSRVVLEESSAHLSFGLDAGWLSWSAGAGVRTSDVSQAGTGRSRIMPSANTRIGVSSGGWRSHLSMEVLQVPGGPGRDATLSSFSKWVLAHSGSEGGFNVDVGYVRGIHPEAGQLLEWARAGLDMADWMTLPLLDNERGLPGSLDVGVAAFRTLWDEWTGWLEGRVRWMDGQVMPDRIIDQRFGIGPLLPVWTWSFPHSGWLFSRALGVERLETNGIAWRAFLQFYHVSSEGDDVFFRHQTGFPRHRFSISASDERSGGFSWALRAGYHSAWTWPEYAEPARRRIPANVVVDATIGKTLFSGYVRTLVSLLNLPDRALEVHPSGVNEQLAIRLTLTFSTNRRMASESQASRPGPPLP